MKKKGFVGIIVLFAVLVAILIAVVLYFIRENQKKDNEMNEIIEMMNFEKEQLEHEYMDLSIEFDGYTANLSNDSLVKLLDVEKLRVQQLLEELRVTKSTNARRIAELKKELSTVRQVMVHYVNQIDSLNRINQRLTDENIQVTRKYQEASQTVVQLSKEKENLSEVVTRASIIEISRFEVVPLNKKDRKTNRFSQIAKFQFNYTIAKNITAIPGSKTIYFRLTRPDNVLLLSGKSGKFAFEDTQLEYTEKKEIEYQNEEVNDVIYWVVDGILQAGVYRADFFLDGNRIGSFPFGLEK